MYSVYCIGWRPGGHPMPESNISSSQGLWIWLLMTADIVLTFSYLQYWRLMGVQFPPEYTASISCLTYNKVKTSQKINCNMVTTSLLPGVSCLPITKTYLMPALQRKSHFCIHFWELRGLSPNFHIHVSVSDLYIPRIGPHISCSRIGRYIVGIYKSLTGPWNTDCGGGIPFLGIIVSNFRYWFFVVCFHKHSLCQLSYYVCLLYKLPAYCF